MIDRERTFVDFTIVSHRISRNKVLSKVELIATMHLVFEEAEQTGYTDIMYRIEGVGRIAVIVAYVKLPEDDDMYNQRILYELENEDRRRYEYNELKKEFENE